MIQSATLRSFSGVMGMPLARGDAGVEQTICVLRCLIDDAVKDPAINVQAIQILRDAGVANFGVWDRLRAFYDWISQPSNFLYVPDPIGPFGPKETVRPARTLFQVKGGDCDDYSALLASLLGTVGIRTRLVTISADRSSPNDFSHIYPEAEAAPGRWVPLDAARPGAQFGIAPPFYFRKRIWSLEDDSYTDVTGAQRAPAARNLSSLNGYAFLGQADGSMVPQDISAIGQSVANVISASKGNPYGSFQTPYTPVAPAAGYGTPGYPGGPPGASLSLAGISPVWLILGLGVALVAARRL
jgi:hypothetical protein